MKRHARAVDDSIAAPDLSSYSPEYDEHLYVEAVLRQIPDERKRLAFRLYMDGVPRHSIKRDSIASALDVSAKTVGTWIRETKRDIRDILGETS